MDTDACPVSRMTSTAAGRSSSAPSSSSGSPPGAGEPDLRSFSWTFSSIFCMTSSEYWTSPVDLTKLTTRSISSGVM